jgi:hypothetical protein
MADLQEHAHRLIHSVEGIDGGPLNAETADQVSEITYSHAHEDGATPHHHVATAEEPKPKPDLETKVSGLWADVKRDTKGILS